MTLLLYFLIFPLHQAVYMLFLTGWRSLSCTKPCHGVYQRLIHAQHAQSRQIKWQRVVLEGQQAMQASAWHWVVKMLVVNRCSVSALIVAFCWPLTRGQVAEDDKLWLVCAAQYVYLCVCVCALDINMLAYITPVLLSRLPFQPDFPL